MKNRIANLAIMISLSGALAFAGEKPKHTSDKQTDAQSATAAVTSYGDTTQSDVHGNARNEKRKTNSKSKQSPSQQEQEYDRMLLAIYG